MRKWMPVILIMMLMATHMQAQALDKPAFALEPRCFTGTVDYSHYDDQLAIEIHFESNGTLAYFICDIQTTDPAALKSALSHDKVNGTLENTSQIAWRNDAVLAINGDDYGVHKYGVIVRDGQVIRAKNTTRHMLYLQPDGNLKVVSNRKAQTPKELATQLSEEGVQQAWEFGPELLRDGEAVDFDKSFDLISTRSSILEPRTAIGQISPLHYVIIVVDGRRDGYSNGISLAGLQQLFIEAGAQTAFNLDGGGSTTLVFEGKVINRPSGGKERPVSDILYF